MSLSLRMSGVVFSGTWESEGHKVSFLILEDNTVQITESMMRDKKNWSNTKRIEIDEAIKRQDKLINMGYTRGN
jgi:Zn-finger domain-containing protein